LLTAGQFGFARLFDSLSDRLLGRDQVAFLNDLILARAVSTMGADQMTAAGDILSDASYMSPEQLGSGYPLDHRPISMECRPPGFHLKTSSGRWIRE